MDAAILRRYLQPSPTLRWHPWAPLAAGVLLLVFAFALGAWWGASAERRIFEAAFTGQAGREMIRMELESSRPAAAAVWQAKAFDDVVRNRAERPVDARTRLRDRIDWVFFCLTAERARCDIRKEGWVGSLPRDDDAIKRIAEYRLRNLSPAAPGWRRTSTYCEETMVPLTGRDLRDDFARTAAAYSQVLGRRVSPEELAPAVEGWRCEWKGKP